MHAIYICYIFLTRKQNSNPSIEGDELTGVSDGGGKEEKNHPRLTEGGHHFPEVAGGSFLSTFETAPNIWCFVFFSE